MSKRTVLVITALSLPAIAPASAHVASAGDTDETARPGMFGQRPIALAAQQRAADRTFRFSLPAKGAHGVYRVRLHAVSGEEQVSTTLTARRL